MSKKIFFSNDQIYGNIIFSFIHEDFIYMSLARLLTFANDVVCDCESRVAAEPTEKRAVRVDANLLGAAAVAVRETLVNI